MVTMTSADNALKSVYLGAVSEQLDTAINPLLAKIQRSTADVWGKEVRRLAQYGVNGGVGAGTEEGDLPSAAGNNYEQFVTTLKNLYGTIEISDKAENAKMNTRRMGKLEREAAIDRLTREMKEAAKLLEFEHAAFLRDQIDRLRRGENPTVDSSAETERKQNHAQTQRRGRKYLGKR